MGGATLVAGLTLIGCILILQRNPDHPSLKPRATALICVVLLQVSLGIAVFIMRLLDMDNSIALAVAAAAHVTTGALTLAAGTILTKEYRRVFTT